MAPRYLSKEALDSRENDILDHANLLIQQEGFSVLTMDKLVSCVSYSKGTVYNHFSSKDDVFVALCNRCMQDKIALFLKANKLETNARYKMLAVCFSYMLSTVLNPNNFILMACTTTDSFENASHTRTNQHMELNNTLRELCNGIIEEAIQNGELVLKENMCVDEASLMIYAMIFGSVGLFLKKDVVSCPQNCMLLESLLLSHMNTIMDGLNWKKSESERSQHEFIQHLKEEVFLEEITLLQQRGIPFTD